MAELYNTHDILTKIVSLVVAVVVFACVLVPVVGSMANGGDSGSGSGTTTYTNTGDYYYKEMDSNDHTLRMTVVTESMDSPIGNLTVTYDGVSVLTQRIDMSSQEPMCLAPFLIGVWDYGNGGDGPISYLVFGSTEGLTWVTPASNGGLHYHPISITHQEEGGGVMTLCK